MRVIKITYDFHLQPVNNTFDYYIKLGAVPLLRYGDTIIVAFLRDIKPSDYFKKISNDVFEYDDFVI